MKKLLLSLIVAFAMTATAQNKIELTSLGKYRQFKSEVTKARAKAAPGSKEKTVGVLVEMNQGNTVGQLEGKVSHIAFDRGTLGKVYVTLSQLDRLNSLAEVKRIAFEQKLQKRLDKAAPAMKTAIVDDNVMNAVFPVQFGAGKVDALAGLKRVLAEAPTSVKELNERGGKNILIELKGDRTISVFAANETQLNATLYTADGRTVSQVSISGNTLDINAPSAGIYVLKVGGLKSAAVRKVVVE